MKKPEQIGEDLSYLSGQGADAPQKEDITSAIRTLEYKELYGGASAEEDLVASIEADESSAEVKKGEFVILERRVKSELPGFDFYIARKQRGGKVFEPETVLVAKRNNVHYIQKLDYEINEAYNILNEKNKLLPPDQLDILNEQDNILTILKTKSPYKKPYKKTGSGDILKKSDRVLGEGGMSMVYPGLLRKKDKFIPKGVAVKKANTNYREGDGNATEREVVSMVKKLKNLDPDNWQYIVNPIDTIRGDVDGGVWELLSTSKEGNLDVEDLDQKIEDGDRIPFEKKLTIILQLFKALATISKLGINHRDIKPSNILLTPDGIKLCDFGLMVYSKKFLDPKYSKKASNLPDNFYTLSDKPEIVVGTPDYMHPRIFKDMAEYEEKNNPRYDVYSAVITAIELLTDGDTISENIIGSGDSYEWFMQYDESIKEILHRFKETFEHDIVKSSFDQNEANNFVKLIEKSISDCRQNNAPIEELLPSPDEIISVLEKMGVKEKY